MRHAVAYEWVRIRTLRSTWWLTGLTLLIGIGISGLLSWALHHEFSTTGSVDLDAIGAALATQLAAVGVLPSLISFLLAIIGIFAWGHEYRHGMVRASLTALNSRPAFWAAKFAVVGAWIAVTGLVTMTLAALLGDVILHDYVHVLNATTFAAIGWQTLYAVLLAWMAMAFTVLTRSQAFALVTIFLWPLLIETLFDLFFTVVPQLRDDRDLLRFLPFRAGNRMVAAIDDASDTFGDPLSAVGGTVVFGGVALVLMAVSLVLFRRRDA